MKKFILNVGDSTSSVFSVNELANYIPHSSDGGLRLKISNYAKNGYINRIARGLYSLPNKEIKPFELANKIYSPSYISFFSALYHHGIIFQANPLEITLAYKKSEIRKFCELGLEIHLKCVKEDILLNKSGLIIKDNYTIAGAERAFLDTIYLYNNTYFDNLSLLDIKIIKVLLPIYKRDKMMLNRVRNYFPNI